MVFKYLFGYESLKVVWFCWWFDLKLEKDLDDYENWCVNNVCVVLWIKFNIDEKMCLYFLYSDNVNKLWI